MSDDYRQGFKDGFSAGLEEGKKLAPKQTRLDDYVFGQPRPPYVPQYPQYDPRETCPKCGMKISGVMGYVCSSPNCPTFVQVTC